jgi:hypothetical protein
MTRQPLGEDPPHHVRGLRVGLKPVRPPPPGSMCLVRMRTGISQPVPIRRTASQVTPLLTGLGGHRGPDPDTCPGHLTLRRQPEHRHRPLIMLRRVIDPATRLRHPQLAAVMLEQRRHRRVLAAVERPLILPDRDRIPAPVRIRERGDQSGSLRTARPRHCTALPDVEELRRDHPDPADEGLRLRVLPGPRRHRILPVLGRHPPVEHEPQPVTRLPAGPPPTRCLRPRRQPASLARGQGRSAFPLARYRHGRYLPPSTTQHPQVPGIPGK